MPWCLVERGVPAEDRIKATALSIRGEGDTVVVGVGAGVCVGLLVVGWLRVGLMVVIVAVVWKGWERKGDKSGDDEYVLWSSLCGMLSMTCCGGVCEDDDGDGGRGWEIKGDKSGEEAGSTGGGGGGGGYVMTSSPTITPFSNTPFSGKGKGQGQGPGTSPGRGMAGSSSTSRHSEPMLAGRLLNTTTNATSY